MAHREDVSVQDLVDLKRLILTATAKRDRSIAPGRFEIAESCFALFDEALEAIYDAEPTFARWSLWGPSILSGSTLICRFITSGSHFVKRGGTDETAGVR
jgi:hypothetical protein